MYRGIFGVPIIFRFFQVFEGVFPRVLNFSDPCLTLNSPGINMRILNSAAEKKLPRANRFVHSGPHLAHLTCSPAGFDVYASLPCLLFWNFVFFSFLVLDDHGTGRDAVWISKLRHFGAPPLWGNGPRASHFQERLQIGMACKVCFLGHSMGLDLNTVLYCSVIHYQ